MSKTNKWLKLGATWLVLQLGLVMQALPANDWDSEFDLALGYRRDRIETDVHSNSSFGDFSASDDLEIEGLDLFILGLKARLGYCNWYARGYAYWGWGSDGEYKEHFSFDGDTFTTCDSEFRNRIDVNRYRTQDYSLGVGYLFDLCFCGGFEGLYIGPVVGWSYHRQNARLGHDDCSTTCTTFTTNGHDFLDDLEYTTKWYGPWLGIDFVYEYCEFIFDFGYEYHWAQWKADWDLNCSAYRNGAFSDSRHSRNAYGNVVYADIKWALCDCWVVGLGFMYQDFESKRGKLRNRDCDCSDFSSSFSSSGSFDDRVRRASWRAASIELDLGYSF